MTTEPSTRLTRMCHVLKLNCSSFYTWVYTRQERRLKICSDALIGAQIKTIFDDEHGLYGAKRIAAPLKGRPSVYPGQSQVSCTNHHKPWDFRALLNAADVSLLGVSLATVSCQI